MDLIHVPAGHHVDDDAFSVMCPSMIRDDQCNVELGRGEGAVRPAYLTNTDKCGLASLPGFP